MSNPIQQLLGTLQNTPSTAGWDLLVAVNTDVVNQLLFDQYVEAMKSGVPNALAPMSGNVPFSVADLSYELEIQQVQLSAPQISIEPGGDPQMAQVSFYLLSGSLLLLQNSSGQNQASVVTYSQIVPGAGYMLSGKVRLDNVGLVAGQQNVGLVLQGGSLGTNIGLQAGDPSIIGSQLQDMLSDAGFSISYPIAGFSLLPANGLAITSITGATQAVSSSDSGRLLLLIATNVTPGGGSPPSSLPASVAAANFVPDGCDTSMMIGCNVVLNLLCNSLNTTPGLGGGFAVAGQVINFGSTNLAFPNKEYSVGGGFPAMTTAITGTTNVYTSSMQFAFTDWNNQGSSLSGLTVVNSEPGGQITFGMSVAVTVRSVLQDWPTSCNITATSMTAANGPFGAALTGQSVALTFCPSFGLYADFPSNLQQDQSFQFLIQNQPNFDLQACLEALNLPELANYVYTSLQSAIQATGFPGTGGLNLPNDVGVTPVNAYLPADLLITASSNLIGWTLEPSAVMIGIGQSVTFSASGSNVPSSLSWSCSPPAMTRYLAEGVLSLPADLPLSGPTTVMVIASDSNNSMVSASAVVSVVPEAVVLNPVVCVIGPGESATFLAAFGTQVDNTFTWSFAGMVQPGVGQTATYTAPISVASVTTVDILASQGAASASGVVVVTPIGSQLMGMVPVQSTATIGGPAVTIAVTLGVGVSPISYRWDLFPEGTGTLNPDGATCSYTPPSNGTTPFVAILLVVGTLEAGSPPSYGVAVIDVVPSSTEIGD